MPTKHPRLVSLHGDRAYARFLDDLIGKLNQRSGHSWVRSRHHLTELAIEQLGRDLGVLSPPRLPPHGGARRNGGKGGSMSAIMRKAKA